MLTGRSGDRLEAAAKRSISAARARLILSFPISSDKATPAMLELRSQEAEFAGLDILVNNTGGPPPGAMS
jgi:3-oxoacyl-[acyl-carrier protein] reductase